MFIATVSDAESHYSWPK